MAFVSLVLTDDLRILPWNPGVGNVMGITIERWHGQEEFAAGRSSTVHLSTDQINLHGTRDQIKAFALRLLEQTTGEKWEALNNKPAQRDSIPERQATA